MEFIRNSNSTLEIVTTQRPIEFVRSFGSDNYFKGYAAVFYDGTEGTAYNPLPNVEEHISRSAFDDVVNDKNVEAWYNHSENHVLGSVATNTLFLEIDNVGLKYSIPFDPSDPDHLKVKSKLEKGIATGASFQATGRSKLNKQGDKFIRTIEKIEKLREISIVNRPAYTSASAILRSEIQNYEATLERIQRSQKIS